MEEVTMRMRIYMDIVVSAALDSKDQLASLVVRENKELASLVEKRLRFSQDNVADLHGIEVQLDFEDATAEWCQP